MLNFVIQAWKGSALDLMCKSNEADIIFLSHTFTLHCHIIHYPNILQRLYIFSAPLESFLGFQKDDSVIFISFGSLLHTAPFWGSLPTPPLLGDQQGLEGHPASRQ